MYSQPGKTKFQIDLRQHLRDQNISGNLVHLICEIAEASKYVINAVRTRLIVHALLHIESK